MTLKFYDFTDAASNEISIDEYLQNCLFVNEGFHYRGQGDKYWDLVPSLFRENSGKLLDLTERESRLKYYDVNNNQFNLDFNALIKCAPNEEVQLPEKNGYKTLTMLTFFQHYGIPTPLLDWTMSPLIALFMSMLDRPPGADGISIFQLDPLLLPKDDVIFQPNSKIPFKRIETQLGGILFFGTCVPDAVIFRAATYAEYINNVKNAKFIKKLNIHVDAGDDLKIANALYKNGFSPDKLFPDSAHWISKKIRKQIIS